MRYKRILLAVVAVLIVGSFTSTLFDEPPNAQLIKTTYAQLEPDEKSVLDNIYGLYNSYAVKSVALKVVLFIILANSAIILTMTRKKKRQKLPEFNFANEQKKLQEFYEEPHFAYDLPKFEESRLPRFYDVEVEEIRV